MPLEQVAVTEVCLTCDEYWFDNDIGFVLAELIREHRPAPGEVRTIEWIETHAV